MDDYNTLKARFPHLGIADCCRHLKEIEDQGGLPNLKPLRIAVLRSYTVETIEPLLKLKLMIEGYSPEFHFGKYNNYVQEILEPASPLYEFSPHVLLLLVRREEILPDLNRDFGGKSFAEWEAVIREAVGRISTLLGVLEERLSSQIIVQNLSLPPRPYWGIYDVQQPEGESYLIAGFNHLLAKTMKERKSAFLWDFDGLIRNIGQETVNDPKMWYLSKNPFRSSAYVKITADLSRYILSAVGKQKKCIVLDLDNTLWGGIAGEDGFDGVALGFDYPGNCYREFQERLKILAGRGILLALNSKNNESDALEIIDKHPYMVLRRDSFSAMRINWNDKARNMQELREELNIGFESMIFLDDNPAECELIRSQCPEIDVVCLPEKPYLIPDIVSSLGCIENLRITTEDRKKGEMYRAQTARKQFEKSSADIEEFLKGLEMEVEIEEASDFTVPRIAQLTQKTNQMNLTTRRYTDGEIGAFRRDTDTGVYSVAAKDRFGDNGIIGVMILKGHGEDCFIDTFLLSCRVIGRNIEQTMLAYASDFSGRKGFQRLVGEYIPTPKNKPAADMYQRFGFRKDDNNLYVMDIQRTKIDHPSYIKLNTNIINTANQ